VALAVLLVAAQAMAQISTGELTGRTQDEGGAALPGVTITAVSPQLQGDRVVVSDGNGNYKLPLLPAGTYTVTYELEGFATAVREVKINAGATTRSDPVAMQVSQIEEEIVVTGELETISKTLTGAATFEASEIDKLPVERTLEAATALAPGVHTTGPSDNITISGAMSFENLFLMNGVVMNENLRGQPFDLFIEDAIQETTTSASGISAEYGRFTGGVVNAISKSGGNQFEGSLRASLTNNDWEARTPLSSERKDDINEEYAATLGGYFWKDHLWFFGAGRDTETSESQTTRAVTNIPFERNDTETRIEGKLTLSPHPSHSVIASYFEIDEVQNNYGSFTFLDLASLQNRKLPQEMIVGNYTGILSSSFFVEALYSEREFFFADSGNPNSDLIHGTLMRRRGTSHRWFSPTFCASGPPRCPDEERSNNNTVLKGSYFLSTEGAGTHDFVFGYDTFDDIRFAINRQTGNDFTIYASDIVVDDNNNIYTQFLGDDVWIRWWAVFNEDLAQPTSFVTNSYFVNDSWQLNEKWSINVGARYDENDGVNSSGAKVASDSKFSPRLGLMYDVKGDGDLLINASYATYVAGMANDQGDATTTGGAIGSYRMEYTGPLVNVDCGAGGDFSTCVSTEVALQTLWDWYFANGGTTSLADDLTLLPNVIRKSIPGVTEIIPDTMKSPSTDEIAVGVTKRLGTKGLFRADVVLREWEDFYSTKTDLETGQVTTPSGIEDLTWVGNFDDGLERDYMGLHTQFRYRFSDRLTLAGNYTYSQLEGNIVGETVGSGPVSAGVNDYPEYRELSWNAPVGDLSADQRHKLRAWAIYDVIDGDRNHLSVSLMQNFFSGTPYGSGTGSFNPTPYVTNPGYIQPDTSRTYWFENRDTYTTDDITRTDLGLNYSFGWQVGGRDMEVFITSEVLNIFNEQGVDFVNDDVGFSSSGSSACSPNPCAAFNPFTETPVEGVHWAKRDDFGKPEDEFDYQIPRTFRVSLGFRF
jgi:hypothetical protein